MLASPVPQPGIVAMLDKARTVSSEFDAFMIVSAVFEVA
jgi:hypothetical protein